MASAGELLKFSLQGASDRAGLAIADGAEVDLPQAHNFGGGSADEYFVCDIQLVARNRFLDHGVTQVLRQRDQTVARDALEYRASSTGCKSHYRAPQKYFRRYTRRRSPEGRA